MKRFSCALNTALQACLLQKLQSFVKAEREPEPGLLIQYKLHSLTSFSVSRLKGLAIRSNVHKKS